MARVAYVDTPAYEVQPPAGYVPSTSNITRALQNSPNAAYYSGVMANYIRNLSPLDARLREMAIIQVGYANCSPYEYVHHVEIGLRTGVSEDDIRAIADETAGRPTALSALDKAVLRAAREISHDLAVSDETFAVLREALDEESLVDLIMAVSNYCGVCRVLESLKVDVEDEFKHFLDRFPLPEK